MINRLTRQKPANSQALLMELLLAEGTTIRYTARSGVPPPVISRSALHRCAYCRSLIDTLRCPNCGAPAQ